MSLAGLDLPLCRAIFPTEGQVCRTEGLADLGGFGDQVCGGRQMKERGLPVSLRFKQAQFKLHPRQHHRLSLDR